MSLFKKKVEPRFTGDIEMVTIPTSKRLGNKTRKNISPVVSSPKSKHTPILNISPVGSSPKSKHTPILNILPVISSPKSSSTLTSVSSIKTKKARAKKIYTKRSKYSKCRGLAKPVCITKKRCMFTNGEFRKYCRKKYNRRVNL